MATHPMQNQNFSYRIIKARVAEAIIKELFLRCHYYVYEYGMDRTMPTIMDNIKFLNSDIARKIRSTPDFVVQDATNGDLFYVEVKYRKNGNFSLEEIGVDFPYKNAIFIVVSKNDIQWIAFEHLLAGQYLGEKSIRHIENCPHFRLDGAIVAEYKEYARNFFSNVD